MMTGKSYRKAFAEIFAVVASYLMLTITIASATQVSVFVGTTQMQTFSFDPESWIDKSVSVNPSNLRVSLKLENSTPSAMVQDVWIYVCENNDPDTCMDSEPFVGRFTGNVDTTYGWSTISAGNPETANILWFVKASNAGKVSTLSYWTVIERQGASSFSVKEEELSGIKYYAKDFNSVPKIRSFMENYLTVPANPAWISKVVFTGASSLFTMDVSSESGLNTASGITSSKVTGNQVSSIAGGYKFVFPSVSSGIMGSAAFVVNPSYVCGDHECEGGLGETSSNCCLDCPCGEGWYCEGGCKSESLIGLTLFGSFEPSAASCQESHTINVPVEVQYAPSSYTINSMCKVGGTYGSCTCTRQSGDIWTCAVVIPAMGSECESGDYTIADNGIRFDINYMDGGVQAGKTIETSFPDITVGSYTCGMDGCESSLGENSGNCCYDCGCASGYCNYLPGSDYGSGKCTSDPTISNIVIANIDPRTFSSYSPGDGVKVNAVLNNAPKTLVVESVSCAMGCVSGSDDCTSSCSASWAQSTSSDPEKFNMSVHLDFEINEYNNLMQYSLSPEITFIFRYRNGTGEYITKNIAKQVSQVSIGSHWCGDRIRSGDEDSINCCYDAGCPEGQYCDTQSMSDPTEGDACKQVDFTVVLDSMSSLYVDDAYENHVVQMTAHVPDYPSGLSVVPECEFAGGGVRCDITCTGQASGNGDYNMLCEMIIPAIDYVNSPYFDDSGRRIVLTDNSLNFTLYYNNGYGRSSVSHEEQIGDATIAVIGHCGEGSGDPLMMCESWLGEDFTTCCRDCGCPEEDSFCYMGEDFRGTCLAESSIGLEAKEFDPDPIKCVIGRAGGECFFIKKGTVIVDVLNPPSDLTVLDAFVVIDNENATDVNCIQTATPEEWKCAFLLDSRPGSTGMIEKGIELFMEVGYTLGGVDVTNSISDTSTVRIEKKESVNVATCQMEIQRLENEKRALEANQDSYELQGYMMYATGVMTMLIAWVMIDTYCELPATWALCVAAWIMLALGLAQIYLGYVGMGTGDGLDLQLEQINDMITEQTEMCASDEFEEMSLAAEGMDPIAFVAYQHQLTGEIINEEDA